MAADIEALVRRHVGETDAVELAAQHKVDALKAAQVDDYRALLLDLHEQAEADETGSTRSPRARPQRGETHAF